MGVSSGSPVHFVGNPLARTVYVTEGSLKADVAHCLMKRSFVAIAGANNLSRLDPVFSALAHGGTELIVEAHDMDKYRNEMIDAGASKIYLMARKYGMEARRLTWNPNHKGIDDWQLALKRKSTEKEDRNMNFKERYLSGLCTIDHIDECVEEWRVKYGNVNNDRFGKDGPMEYLGLTVEEMEAYGMATLVAGKTVLESLLLAQRKTQRFRVYQLEFTNHAQTKPFAFAGIRSLHEAGHEEPPASEYRLVHDANICCGIKATDQEVLHRLYTCYNDDLPDDYHGRSISMSDVIELYDDENRRFFYCDTVGFAAVGFSPELALPR
jgi:hypothetical protein